MANLITITRYFGKTDDDLKRLRRFIDQARSYSKRIIVAVNQQKDTSRCIEKFRETSYHDGGHVEFMAIEPWVGISTPLNIVLSAIPSEEKFVLIQSVEVQCNVNHIERLLSYFDSSEVLCVGAALDGHQNLLDCQDRQDIFLQGDTSPWNTFVIWNLEKLRRTGFPLCSDFLDPPGMEDAAVIALQQKLFGGRKLNRAITVQFAGKLNWLTDFDHDPNRLEKHQAKMKSKNFRTQQILRTLNVTEDEQLDLLGVEYIRDSFTPSGE